MANGDDGAGGGRRESVLGRSLGVYSALLIFLGLLVALPTLNELYGFIPTEDKAPTANGNADYQAQNLWPWETSPLSTGITAVFIVIVILASLWGMRMADQMSRTFVRYENMFYNERENFANDVADGARNYTDASETKPYNKLYGFFSWMSGRLDKNRGYPSKFAEDPIKRRVREVVTIFEMEEDRQQITLKLTDLPRELDGDRPGVANLNAVLMVTLFAGIIGTFVGLMQFVVSPYLGQAMDTGARGQGLQAENMMKIFAAFQPAFASSLLAYTSFVFVRFHRDRLDEVFQEAVNDFNAYVQRPMKTQLKQFRADVYVDLSAGATGKLDGLAGRLETVHNSLDEATRTIGEVVTDLKGAANSLESASTRLVSQFGPFATELNKASEAWQGTTSEFQKTFEAFNTTASDLQSSLRQSINEIDGALKAGAFQVSDASDRLQHNVGTAAQDLSAVTGRVGEMLDDLKHSAEEAARTRKALQDSLGTVESLVGTLQTSVDQLPATLNPVMTNLAESNDALRQRVVSSIDGLCAELHTASKRIGACADHLAPDEDGDALVSVVGRIDRRLANSDGPNGGGPAGGPAAPPAGDGA